MSRRPFTVGLTGGIGSGKSAATDRFSALGATIVDTDLIAHELTAPGGAAMPAIRESFGDTIIGPDGRLDRAAMRELAFSDPSARSRLEAILHPMIRSESARRTEQAEGSYVVLAVPLLIESGYWRERCDRVCVVDCPEAVQIERVQARSGLDERQIRAIIDAQASRDARLAAADDVIDNSGTREALQGQVDALHAHYLELARNRRQQP